MILTPPGIFLNSRPMNHMDMCSDLSRQKGVNVKSFENKFHVGYSLHMMRLKSRVMKNIGHVLQLI